MLSELKIALGLDENENQVCLFELDEEGKVVEKINVTPQFLDTVWLSFATEDGQPKQLINAQGNGFEILIKPIFAEKTESSTEK